MKKIFSYIKNTWLIWVFLLIVIGIAYYTFIQPFLVDGELSELRFYVRLVILLMMIQTFALLRMYNAIVGNTKFLIKLYQTLKTLNINTNNLIRAYGRLRSSVEKLNDQVSKRNKIKENENLKTKN